MKKIACFSAIVAVFVVGSATAFARGTDTHHHAAAPPTAPLVQATSKVAEIQGTIPFADLASAGKVYAAFKAALGTDRTAIGAFQEECGVPVSGEISDHTEACLHTIADTIANQQATFAATQRAVERDLAGARAASRMRIEGFERPRFKVSPEAIAQANAVCSSYNIPGTQAKFSTEKKFACVNAVFRVKKGGTCTESGGVTTCTLEVAPLGAKYGRGNVVPPADPVTREKPKGWCGGSTLCRVAVITAASSVAVGVGFYVGHVIKDGDWSPITVLR